MMWCLLCTLVLITMVSASSKPHIILIVADDLGWNDVSMNGANQIPTPNIDALAFSGVLLRRHYVLPTCTPSRAALLTGMYPIRTGMQGYPLKAGEPRGLPLDVPLLPQRLKELGYTTRLVGKWHLGFMKSKYTPTQRGFDSHFGYWNGYTGYFDHCVQQKLENGTQVFYGHDFWRDLEPARKEDGKYATNVFTEEAQRIIRDHDKATPLFLYVAHLAVHAGGYNRLEVPSEEQARNRFWYITDPQRQLYAETVKTLDDSVGDIITSLKESAMLNNSIIVFLSDNGGMTEGIFANKGSNWPFRGIKLTLFEGGVHGVAAVWSPLLKDRGRVMSQLMHITDWFPTLYHAAGGDPTMLYGLDGVDQWEELLADKGNSSRQEVLLNIDEHQNNSAYIYDHWKLVQGSYKGGEFEKFLGDSGRDDSYPTYSAINVVQAASRLGLDYELNEETVLRLRNEMAVNCTMREDTLGTPPCADYCLFDLRTDPCETRNVANNNPDVVQMLQARLRYFNEQLVPQLNKPVDNRSDPANFNNTWMPWLDNV
ncbi:arylsulfatase B [Anabrus simplex]|uniref:arylsulfatase B n=1 Tax=Anabrus simplex TaxID=316456 RepID=UPI0035A2C3E7